MERLQGALIAGGSVLVAATYLKGSAWATPTTWALLIVFATFRGLLSEVGVRAMLPSAPVAATRLIDLEWIGWVALASLLGGIPMWLATKLPKDPTPAASNGLSVLAVVAGLTIVDVLKKLAIDDKLIEKAAESRWKARFRAAYGPMFPSTIAKHVPMPGHPGQTMPSLPWQALYLDPVHGGYGREQRQLRAKDLKPPWLEPAD